MTRPSGIRLFDSVLWPALLVGVALSLLVASGTFHAEFGSSPDEPAHVMNGIFIHDYILHGLTVSPRRFAEDYYVHYPKIALGIWGPFGPLLFAVWMLVFSCSSVSILLMMASMYAAIGILIYQFARDWTGRVPAALASLLFLCVPVSQADAQAVMLDLPVALAVCGAMIAMVRFMELPSPFRSLVLAAALLAASLIKANGAAMLPLPIVAAILSRRWQLLSRRSFWLPYTLLLVVAVAWLGFSAHLVAQTEALPGFSVANMWKHAALVFYTLQHNLGWVVCGFALLGIWRRVVMCLRSGAVKPVWVAAAAVLGLGIAFHILAPQMEPRYLVMLFPPALLFAAAGLSDLAARLTGPRRSTWPVLVLGSVVLGGFILEAFTIVRKPPSEMRAAAELLCSRPDLKDAAFLVVADAPGEGAFIVETALRDHRPQHFVLRQSKVVKVSTWDDRNQKLLFNSPQQLMEKLRSIPVAVVVWQREPGHKLVVDQLIGPMLESYASQWRLLRRFPETGLAPDGKWLELYELASYAKLPKGGSVNLDMKYTLKTNLQATPGKN